MNNPRLFALLCLLWGGVGQGVVASKLPELLAQAPEIAFAAGVSTAFMYAGILLAAVISDFAVLHQHTKGKRGYGLFLSRSLAVYAAVLISLGLARAEGLVFALRLLEGLTLGAIFAASATEFEIETNPATASNSWSSYAGAALMIGMGLGPVISLVTPEPLACLGMVAGGALVLALAIALERRRDSSAARTEQQQTQPPRYFVTVNKNILVVGLTGGFVEASLVALLPILAAREFQLSPALCLTTAFTAAALGSMLCDWRLFSSPHHPGKLAALLLMGLPVTAAALGLLQLPLTALALLTSGCFGAFAGSLHATGLAWLSHSSDGSLRPQAAKAFAKAHGLGAILGPVVTGLAVQQWQSTGLLQVMTITGLGFAAIAAATTFLRFQ